MDQPTDTNQPIRRTAISFSEHTRPPPVGRPSYRVIRRSSLNETIQEYNARVSGTSQVIHGTTLSFDAAVSAEDFRRATAASLARQPTLSARHLDLPIPLQDLGEEEDHEYIHRVGTASSEVSHSWYGNIWYRYIRVTVPQWACRDMFALERTVLGYIRTSQAMATLGVTIAQFMRLSNDAYDQNTSTEHSRFGFYKIAVPLASICYISALIILLIGTERYYRWQQTMAYGYSMSSGWDFLVVAFLSLAVLLVVFVLNTIITALRDD